MRPVMRAVVWLVAALAGGTAAAVDLHLPPVLSGGKVLPVVATVDLVTAAGARVDARPALAIAGADLVTEGRRVTIDTAAGATVSVPAQTALGLPSGEPTFYRVCYHRPPSGAAPDCWPLVQVPVSATPVELAGLIGATALDPASLTAGRVLPLPTGAGAGWGLALDADLAPVWSAPPAESDPVWAASASHGITATDISQWGSAYTLASSASQPGHSQAAGTISDATTAGRAILTAADAAAQRTSLGLGTAATYADTRYSPEWIEYAIPSPVAASVYDAASPYAGTVTRLHLGCRGAPSGSALTIDLRLAATWGGTASTILNSALSLSAGATEVSTTDIAAPTVAVDDALQIIVTAADAGATAAGCVATVSLSRS